jgi:hypothetical protein
VVVQLADGVEEAEGRPVGLVVRPRHCVFFVLYTHKVAAKVFINALKRQLLSKCFTCDLLLMFNIAQTKEYLRERH